MFTKAKSAPACVRFYAVEPIIDHGRVFYPVSIQPEGDRIVGSLSARLYELFDSRKEAVDFASAMNAKDLTTHSMEWRGAHD